MQKIKLIILLVALIGIVYVILFIYIITGLFFKSSNYESIKVYYSPSGAIIVPLQISVGGVNENSVASGQKYPITSLEFRITNPFEQSYSEFRIACENFVPQYNFWEPTDGEEVYNRTEVDNYVSTHIPEFIVAAPFIKNGYVPIWLEVWYSQPAISVNTNNFFIQIGFDTWEAKYTLDDSFLGGEINGITLLPAGYLNKVVLEISIPSGFRIEDPSGGLIQGSPDVGYVLTKEMRLGESINITVIDLKNEKIKELFLTSSVVLPILGGLFIWIKRARLAVKSEKRGFGIILTILTVNSCTVVIA